jgi:hypothetical protein
MFMGFYDHEEIDRAEEVCQACLRQYIPKADGTECHALLSDDAIPKLGKAGLKD